MVNIIFYLFGENHLTKSRKVSLYQLFYYNREPCVPTSQPCWEADQTHSGLISLERVCLLDWFVLDLFNNNE